MNQERPTPETDALVEQWDYSPIPKVMEAHSRALERQRDELSDWLEAEHLLNDRIRKELEVVKAQRDQAPEEDDRNNQIMIGLMAQRDELMAALEAVLDSATPNQYDNPSMFNVWPIARTAIAKVKGAKP